MYDYLRKPEWIKLASKTNESYKKVGDLLVKLNLNTVCDAARCPNRRECYNSGTATFMLLGNNCTRNCTFCKVGKNLPDKLNHDEPSNIAVAVNELGIKHVVITSVTRDDLDDGGAAHFAKTVDEIRKLNKEVTIEVLIPDFQGDADALKVVINSRPDVINHNVETISRLYSAVRPMADFNQSLELIKRVKDYSNIPTKSGFMVGLGESEEEIYQLLDTLHSVNCNIVTIGQYLQPTKDHYTIREYVHPDIFKKYYDYAVKIGFDYVVSTPLARSSYQAEKELNYLK